MFRLQSQLYQVLLTHKTEVLIFLIVLEKVGRCQYFEMIFNHRNLNQEFWKELKIEEVFSFQLKELFWLLLEILPNLVTWFIPPDIVCTPMPFSPYVPCSTEPTCTVSHSHSPHPPLSQNSSSDTLEVCISLVWNTTGQCLDHIIKKDYC